MPVDDFGSRGRLIVTDEEALASLVSDLAASHWTQRIAAMRGLCLHEWAGDRVKVLLRYVEANDEHQDVRTAASFLLAGLE